MCKLALGMLCHQSFALTDTICESDYHQCSLSIKGCHLWRSNSKCMWSQKPIIKLKQNRETWRFILHVRHDVCEIVVLPNHPEKNYFQSSSHGLWCSYSYKMLLQFMEPCKILFFHDMIFKAMTPLTLILLSVAIFLSPAFSKRIVGLTIRGHPLVLQPIHL